MEPISTTAFISLAVIAITQAIKELSPKVKGAVTLAVSVLVGVLVAVVDTYIGLPDINIAHGVLAALSGSGVVTLAKKV